MRETAQAHILLPDIEQRGKIDDNCRDKYENVAVKFNQFSQKYRNSQEDQNEQKLVQSTVTSVGCKLKRDFKRFSKTLCDSDFMNIITLPLTTDAPTFRFGDQVRKHVKNPISSLNLVNNEGNSDSEILQAHSSTAFWMAFEQELTQKYETISE